MHKPLRILHFAGTLLYGGVGSVVMNLYRNINREIIQFDFCVPRTEKGPLDDEIQSLGGRIITIPRIQSVGLYRYIKIVASVIKANGPYHGIHIHSVHMGALTIFASKIAKVDNIYYHVHSTQDAALKHFPLHSIAEYILKKYIQNSGSTRLACGQSAGEFVYQKSPFNVINNAIDLQRFFPYKSEDCLNIRQSLGISKNSFVVGNIARFVPEKNLDFFIKLAETDKKNRGKLIFLIVGDGELKESFERQILSHGCSEKFILTGNRKDVEIMYNAMDVFCLPSLFEGLPVVLMEAQACGLPCITSSNVTDEGKIGVADYFTLDLDNSTEKWLEIIYATENSRNYDRQSIYEDFSKYKYEIKAISQQLENYYLNR